MRLIDADALIDKLLTENIRCITSTGHELTMSMVVSFVENQPTAYDPDKVVEWLEVERERARIGSIEAVRRGMAINSDKHLIKKHSFEKAIDIVRKGDVE